MCATSNAKILSLPRKESSNTSISYAEQHRSMRICEHMLDQTVPPVRLRVGQPIEEAVALRVLYLVIEIALFLHDKKSPIRDQKLKSRVFG